VRTAEVLQAQANQAGFKVEIKQIDATKPTSPCCGKKISISACRRGRAHRSDGNIYNYFTRAVRTTSCYQSDKVTDLLKKAQRPGARTAKLLPRSRNAVCRRRADAVPDLPGDAAARPSRSNWLQYPDGAFRLQFAKFSREPKRCRISSLSLPLVGRVAGRRPVGWG